MDNQNSALASQQDHIPNVGKMVQSQAQQTESKESGRLARRIKRLSERLESYKEEYYGKEQILTYHAGYSIGYVEGQLSILEDIPPAPEGGDK